MGHVLVHRPAFQGMEVLLQLQVVSWQEHLLAPGTVMPRGGEACHPPADAASVEAEVERQASQVRVCLPGQFPAAAHRALLAADLDAAVDREVLLPLPAAVTTLLLPQCRVGANVNAFPLVVEVGPLVDELEVGDGEKLRLLQSGRFDRGFISSTRATGTPEEIGCRPPSACGWGQTSWRNSVTCNFSKRVVKCAAARGGCWYPEGYEDRASCHS